ncbi:hypothetical protein LguiA_015435 [Lonicera macranthoides]
MAPSKRQRGKTILDMLQSQSSTQQQSLPQTTLPPPPQPTSRNTRSRVNTQSQAPLQSQPQPEASQPQLVPQTTLPPQPPSRNTRSQVNTQSQPPPQPEASQLQDSHSTQQNGTSASESTSTRRGRGVARGLNTWGTGQKLHLEFNKYMQAYGPNQHHLKTHLGIIARNGEQVPLIYEQWKDMPQDILDYIWKEVEDNTNASPEYRENCLKNVGDIWRKWKSQVKTQYYDIWETDEQRLNNKPLRVVQDQWETLVAYWGTEKQQVISAQNKKNRQYQDLNHRTGRTPHAQIRANMEEAGEDTNRINVFRKTRTPKNGGPMNPETQAVIAEMESRRDAVPEEERTPEFIDGVFTQVIGPDGHGCVRTYGKGVTPQVVFGKGNSTEEDKFNKIREETRTEFNTKLDQLIRERDSEINRRIEEAMTTMRTSIRDEVLAELRGGNGPSSIGNVPTSSSVHRPDLDFDLDLDESFSRERSNISRTRQQSCDVAQHYLQVRPVDGTVLQFGQLKEAGAVIEQVKLVACSP